MRKTLKILAVAMAAVSVLVLASCGGNDEEKVQQATQAFETVMDGFKSGDTAVIEEYVDLGDDPELGSALAASLGNIAYEVKSVTVSGNTATVNASITSIDSSRLMQKYIENVAALVSSPDYQSKVGTMTKEEYDALMNAQLISILSSGEVGTVTTDETIEMTKEDGEWKLSGSSLPDKLIGNTLSAIKQIKQ